MTFQIDPRQSRICFRADPNVFRESARQWRSLMPNTEAAFPCPAVIAASHEVRREKTDSSDLTEIRKKKASTRAIRCLLLPDFQHPFLEQGDIVIPECCAVRLDVDELMLDARANLAAPSGLILTV